MKLIKIFSVLAMMVAIVGCGNGQSSNTGFSQINPNVPYYPGTNGVYGNQIPLYAGSVTFRTSNQVEITLSQSVNQGDRLVLSGSNFILNKTCGNNWISFNAGPTSFPMYSPALAVNGQIIPNGYGYQQVTAPSAGVVSMIATANVNHSCVGNQTGTYFMNSYMPVGYIIR